MEMLFLLVLAGAGSPPADAPAPKRERKICKVETRIGTLAGSRRVCKTAAEWDEIAARARNSYEAIQGAHGSTAAAEPGLVRGGTPQ